MKSSGDISRLIEIMAALRDPQTEGDRRCDLTTSPSGHHRFGIRAGFIAQSINQRSQPPRNDIQGIPKPKHMGRINDVLTGRAPM